MHLAFGGSEFGFLLQRFVMLSNQQWESSPYRCNRANYRFSLQSTKGYGKQFFCRPPGPHVIAGFEKIGGVSA